MITLETMGSGGVMVRPLNIIAETDFVWTGERCSDDVYLCEASDAQTAYPAFAPQIAFRTDGSVLDLQIDRSDRPTIAADELVTAIMLNMATRNGRIGRLRARAVLAVGDCEDNGVPVEDLEPHVGISKVALAWLRRELYDRGQSSEVRLQAGTPFRLHGLANERKIRHGGSSWRPAPFPLEAGETSIEMGIMVFTTRGNPVQGMMAAGASTVAPAGFMMAGSPRILDRLGGGGMSCAML